jgi:hypothetical protein
MCVCECKCAFVWVYGSLWVGVVVGCGSDMRACMCDACVCSSNRSASVPVCISTVPNELNCLDVHERVACVVLLSICMAGIFRSPWKQ